MMENCHKGDLEGAIKENTRVCNANPSLNKGLKNRTDSIA